MERGYSGQLRNDYLELINIEGFIIQGRYDAICPIESAYSLANAWPKATLKIIEKAGHSSLEPNIQKALIESTEQIKKIL